MKDHLRPLTLITALFTATITSAEPALEEVRVVGQRNLLNQSLYLQGDQQSIRPDEQVSLNRTVGDIIERLPGVTLNGQGGLLQSYSVRGFSRWRIRTEVDGVPIITDRRAGNSASFVPPELLSNVTVARGPASSLYGSGALGGTVNLASIQPDGVEATLEGQSTDNAIAATLGYGDGEHFAGAVSVRRADRSEDARGRPLNSGYEQVGALLKSRIELDSYDLSLSWLPSYGKDIGKSNSEYPDRGVSDYPEDLHSVVSVQVQNADQWLARLYHHYQDWESRTERIGVRTNVTDYKSHTLGGMAYTATDILSGVGRSGVEWVGRRGVEISDQEFNADGEPVISSENIDGQEDNLAAFVDQQWQLGALSYGGGLRYDYIDQEDAGRSRSDNKLNGNLSASWAANDAWTVSASAGTGFRFPSLTELYFNGVTPRGETVGNPDLAPEENLGFQLGLDYQGNAVSASLHSYINDLDDYIERYRISDELRSYRNLDGAQIWGFEAQLDWQSHEQLRHSLSYQWQRGEDDDGRWLSDLNPPALRYLLEWQGQRYRVQSDLSYRQERDDFGEGEQALDSAVIWNGRLVRQFGSRWEGEIYANNLLDELYLGTADEDAAYQPGRTIGVRLRWFGG
ncbi:TonB-dependent receptor [Halioglobus pacificus]|nr:TonB-dependent receptor [Halioglobus pacificus]